MSLSKTLNLFSKAIIAGLIISIAGCAYLSAESKYFGGFLFSFALFSIIRFDFALFTGRVGYIPQRKLSYVAEVLAAFVGNIAGTAIGAFAFSFTRIWDKVHANASAAMEIKTGDGFFSSFVLGIFCGMLMYMAVENANMSRNTHNDTSMVFGTVLPVLLFIFCGFNHCIADAFYLFLADFSCRGAAYILIVALGNAFGGMLIPLVKRLNREE
ncbi:MAG: formate/nitrite transporter family protein [Ruminococcus sp.]|nr:formate/nitrite transporter family protein [Ruminococcus sp.]